MSYRATCPACHLRLSRWGYVRAHGTCGRCGVGIRPIRSWNWGGNLVSGCGQVLLVGVGLIALALGAMGWVGLFLLVAGYEVLNWYAWPYCTPYELSEPTSASCGVCGYDLRATPERCPECGTARNRQGTA